MENLKECAIVETFRGLDDERKRLLLKTLIKEANVVSETINFENEFHQRFYEFLRKCWPEMSLTFFYESLRRWMYLKEYSRGDRFISRSVGDFFIQAKKSLHKQDNFAPFLSERQKCQIFNEDVFVECKWEFIYITKGYRASNYLVKDLMELSIEDFNQKMNEYGFEENIGNWISKLEYY